MKKFALSTLLLCGLATSVLTAQQAVPVDRPAEPNLVFDDDGGKVQIVPADLSITGPKTFHGFLSHGFPNCFFFSSAKERRQATLVFHESQNCFQLGAEIVFHF